ncbi:hypothetical protein H072_4531 [Dactylellina haptotyla CBS 200.50]|uniref:Uncharacterized protein n=1 Tax=Dactylellina haptotyla (strain CBS 200.50) TaxID=1284197 RepID=S8BQ19_DACHA|nr:hypothetical protein H072_4531 [Dactylellina haptotyla CBS 200.50]
MHPHRFSNPTLHNIPPQSPPYANSTTATTPSSSSHRRAVSYPTTLPTHATHLPLIPIPSSRATARATTRTARRLPRPAGAIPSHVKSSPLPSYLDLHTPDYWSYYHYYYNNPHKMAAYPRDIPSWNSQSAAYYYGAPAVPQHAPPASSPRAVVVPRNSPSRYEQLPTMMPQPAAIPKSYMHATFEKFSQHAYGCTTCYDPLRVHLERRQLCTEGHKLARKVSKALYEEANDKYRRSKATRRRADGWQPIEVDIPKGCEVVRALITAMERGLNINSRPEASAGPVTPVTPSPPTYYDHSAYAYQRRPGPSSDEELYSRSRSRHRDEPESGRSRSTKRSSSVGNAGRKPVIVGIEERQRRPYGGSHSSNGSVDSGYDSTPGSPDHFRRGSQYAEDMKRRKERPKSILKKSISFEREHLLEKEPQTPHSPTKGTSQEKYVFFNISGECLAPGYD